MFFPHGKIKRCQQPGYSRNIGLYAQLSESSAMISPCGIAHNHAICGGAGLPRGRVNVALIAFVAGARRGFFEEDFWGQRPSSSRMARRSRQAGCKDFSCAPECCKAHDRKFTRAASVSYRRNAALGSLRAAGPTEPGFTIYVVFDFISALGGLFSFGRFVVRRERLALSVIFQKRQRWTCVCPKKVSGTVAFCRIS